MACHLSGPILEERPVGDRKLLGIDDPQIIVGHALATGLGIFCLAYGIMHWNDGGEQDG